MHTQIGFDLGSTKHYASAKQAQHFVEKNLAALIKQGVMFNIVIVEQSTGGYCENMTGKRYVPLLNCWRVPNSYLPGVAGAMLVACRQGYTCFM